MSANNYSIDPSLYGESTLLDNDTHQAAQPSAPMDIQQLNELQIPQQSDVDHILRKKRKAREHKACYPCRQRKVKCDLSRPCQTCRDREHPELCDYNPPNKRQTIDHAVMRTDEGAMQGGTVMLGRSEFEMLCQKLNGLEASIADLRRELGREPRAIDPALTSGMSGIQQPVHSHTDLHGLHRTSASVSTRS